MEDSIPKDKPLLEETHVDQSDEHTEPVVEVKNVDEVVVPPVVDENSVEAKDELPHAEEVKFPEKEVVVDDTPPETESRANETQKVWIEAFDQFPVRQKKVFPYFLRSVKSKTTSNILVG